MGSPNVSHFCIQKILTSIQPFSYTAGILFLASGIGLVVYFRYEKARMERKRVAEATKGIGRPKVGGKFELVDAEGKPFTEENLKGKYALVSAIHFWLWTISMKFMGLIKEHEADYISNRSTSASRTAPTSARKSWTKWPT
jgi:hypothetical protein